MTSTPQFGSRTPFRPNGAAPCLCGSGNAFHGCCSARLPGQEIGKDARTAAGLGDWSGALVAARADVAQYTIWHKSNTAPLLTDASGRAIELVQTLVHVDVQALSEYVDAMRNYCYEAGVRDDVPTMLYRLQLNIDHELWRRRIQFLQCLHVLTDQWNEDAGRQEFKKLGTMDNEQDIEILQLYLDLFGRQLGLAETLGIVERVVGLCEDEGERLHYRALKASTYMMAGDTVGARQALLSAIDHFRANAPEADRTLHGRHLFAHSLTLAGSLCENDAMLEEVNFEIEALLALQRWTPSGRAGLLRLRGDVQRQKAHWSGAKDTYVEAYRIGGHSIDQVFIAQATLFANGTAPAIVAIKAVDTSSLSAEENVDYVLTISQIAIESGDQKLLELAEALLRTLDVHAPLFRKQCDELLLSIVDTARSGPSTERSHRVRRLLSGFLFLLTRYVKLEPNIYGLGINIGKMIDDTNDKYVKPKDKS